MTHDYSTQLELPIATPQLRANASEGENLFEVNVRAITLWQPWASLVALGFKRYETRSWSTSYKGKLLIHAAARPDKQYERLAIIEACRGTEYFNTLIQLFNEAEFSLGAVVAIADLTGCQKMWSKSQLPPSATWADDVRANDTEILIDDQAELEIAVGDWQPDRYAWKLENIQALAEPIYCKGERRLWIPSAEIITAVGGVA